MYTVAVQYDDTTDILDLMYDNLQEAIEVRDRIVREQDTDPWAGLQYVYVIVNGRVMI
jgi:hypothetical protein